MIVIRGPYPEYIASSLIGSHTSSTGLGNRMKQRFTAQFRFNISLSATIRAKFLFLWTIFKITCVCCSYSLNWCNNLKHYLPLSFKYSTPPPPPPSLPYIGVSYRKFTGFKQNPIHVQDACPYKLREG